MSAKPKCTYCDDTRKHPSEKEMKMPSVEERLRYWRDRATDFENKFLALELAAKTALNYIENTEGELGITLTSGDKLRAALQPEAPAPGCSDLNCKDPNCTYDSEPAPEYRWPGDNKTKSERATPTEGDPVLFGQNSREELHKQYAKDWQRQIISAGGDENVALQAVTLAALNGLFDHLSTSNSPCANATDPK